jgi:hypothetical protein
VSRDSSVGLALGYELEDRVSRVRFPAGSGNFSLHYRVQNGSGVHPASYPMGTNGSFPNTPSWLGAQLKYRDNFTFTFKITRHCTVF